MAIGFNWLGTQASLHLQENQCLSWPRYPLWGMRSAKGYRTIPGVDTQRYQYRRRKSEQEPPLFSRYFKTDLVIVHVLMRKTTASSANGR